MCLIYPKKAIQYLKDIIKFINDINKDYTTEEMVTLDGSEFVSLRVLTENALDGKLNFTERRVAERFAPLAKTLIKLKDYKMFIKEPIKRKKVVIFPLIKSRALSQLLISFKIFNIF